MKPLENGKYKIEDNIPKLTDQAIQEISDTYTDYYSFRDQRGGKLKQLQGKSLEEAWQISRLVFWNSIKTESEDLEELGLDFSLPFTRKEVMDFVGRIVSLRISPKLGGDGISGYGVKVLQGMYNKWRINSNDTVEKFWQVLYGATNGTLCTYIGFDSNKKNIRSLAEFDSKTGSYTIETKERSKDEVFSEIVPIEEIYLKKLWERNIQKQGKTIRKHEMTLTDFKSEFPIEIYPDAKFVVPGNKIDEQSLFFKLLEGSGVTDTDRITVLRDIDTDKQQYKIMANGIWINKLGNDTTRPLPFKHGMQPYAWSITSPQDEKLAYGVPTPFLIKDVDRILNTSQTMMVERELRAIDPPILTSDFEAPQIIFGQKRVIPVNDVTAYKELQISEPSSQFFGMQNSLQGLMSSFVHGGMTQLAPSRQPRSAREVIEINAMKQDALGNALVMYYDLVRQELELVLKTGLQFYSTGKYSSQEENLIKAFTVPNMNLTQGGVGNLNVRIVKNPKDALALYFEAVEESVKNGRMTEILEVPVEMMDNLFGFFIDKISLEPEKTTELEMASYVQNILDPMVKVFIPAGVADVGKVFRRWLEKSGEHISDYASEQYMSQFFAPSQNKTNPLTQPSGSENPLLQIGRGVINGGASNGGQLPTSTGM